MESGSGTRHWARRCRIEAARATHPATRAFLLELAAEYEAALGECVVIHPDDKDLQGAVADRLSMLAARRKTWARCRRDQLFPAGFAARNNRKD